MPTIDRIGGIKINVYNGDHYPPHIHAILNDFEILIEIETMKDYAGYLPSKEKSKVKAWLRENSDWALQIFYQLNPQLKRR